MALTKRVQIETVSELHNEVESVGIQLEEMVRAFEILGMGGPAKKLRKEMDRLFKVSRQLLAVTESLLEEDTKK